MYNVFIDGKVGTTGLLIVDRFANRKDVSLITLDESDRKDIKKRAEAINQSDITFLCLPDAASIESVSMLKNEKTKIIDTSTAHRCNGDWAYGFPELSAKHFQDIHRSNRVAVPGCHASGLIALIYPLIINNIMPKDYPIVCHSLTGYSGGGKSMIAEYQDKERSKLLDSPRQYALNQTHKHQKEMQYHTGLSFTPIFNPIVSGYFSGMEVSIPIYTRLLSGKHDVLSLTDVFKKHYDNQKLVKVESYNGDFLSANLMSNTDGMVISVTGNEERILLTANFDNLGKGASGTAIECMNIMMGLDPAYSLKSN